MKSYMAFKAVGKRIILLMMWAQTTSTSSFEDSFWIFSCLFAFFLLHVFLKLFFITDTSPRLRINAPIKLERIQICEIVKIVNFLILQSQSQIFSDKACHITVLNRFLLDYLLGLLENLVVDLVNLLVYSVFVVLHEVEEEGYFHGQFGKVALFGVGQIILPLLLLQIGQESLSLGHKKCLLERDFNHLYQLPTLKNAQQMPLSTLDQHQGLPCFTKLTNHFNITIKLLKGEFSSVKHLVGSLNHLLESGDFLIEDVHKQRNILFGEVLFVVDVYLFPPKFLKPHLLLHLVLEDSKLGRNARY